MKIRLSKPKLSYYLVFLPSMLLFARSFVTRIIPIPHFYAIALAGLACIVSFLLVLVLLRYKVLGEISVIWALFFAYFTIVSIFKNYHDAISVINRNFICLSFVLILDAAFHMGTTKTVVSGLMLLAEILNYGNTASMLLFPNGMFRTVNYGTGEKIVRITSGFVRTASSRVHWLLGHQTGLMQYILPFICIALIYSYVVENKPMCKRTLCLLIACVIETLIAKSGTNYAILFLIIAFLLLLRIVKLHPMYVVGAVVAFYLFASASGLFEAILSILSLLVGRPVLLADRIQVWRNVIEASGRHLIFGNGFINESSRVIWNLFGVANPHSTYLWVLFEGGLFGILIYTGIIFYAANKCRKYEGDACATIILASLYAMYIAMITDDYVFRNPFALMIFVMAHYVDRFKVGAVELNE